MESSTAGSERLLRANEVEARTALRKSARAQRIKEGTFPPPVKIGARAVAWKASEIDAWIASRDRAHAADLAGSVLKR